MLEIENILDDARKTVENFRKNNPNWIVIIRWATATGKSKLSILLSDFFDTEIISCDSRQIFKDMDIWTDKISLNIRNKIPHYQIDIIDPNEHYTTGQRKQETQKYIEQIHNKKKLAMIAGGTWLYIDTIYKNFSLPECPPDYPFREKLYKQEEVEPGYLHKELKKIDPQEALKNHPNSTRYLVRALEIYHLTWIPKSEIVKENPVKYPTLMLGLRRNKEDTNTRINERIKQMFKEWLIQEVENLLKKGYTANLQSMQGIGYKQTLEYLAEKCTKEELEENIQQVTHRLAKKQRTRFRRYIADQNNNPKPNVTYKVRKLS